MLTYMCTYMYAHMHRCPCRPEDVDSLELMWVPGIELWSSGRAVHALNY